MKLYIASDLHLEFASIHPGKISFEADVILLPGDIWKNDHGIHWARATWPGKHIVYVAGNHEYYGEMMRHVESALRVAAAETGVHYLQNDEVVLDGVRFIGATLWTDTEIFCDRWPQSVVWRAIMRLNDFRVIFSGGNRAFSIREMIELHRKSRVYIKERLAEPFDGKTVVLTHHAPSMKSVHQRYADDPTSAGFASNCSDMFGVPVLWVHGHMHDSLDYIENGTRVICNPRGYASQDGRNENEAFDPGLVVEI